MKYCSECGHKLVSGTEKFCSECGHELNLRQEGVINIGNTSGDVIGTGISGNKNVIEKESAYTRVGNAIVVNINNQSSQEIVEVLRNVMAVTTQLEQTSTISKEDIKTKLQESTNTQQQIKNVLDDVNKVEKNTGTEIQEIKAGDLQIATKELSLKEVIHKGNEHYYKNEYNEAIKCYDKAMEINPNDAEIWTNKGWALDNLGKYEEAIECYDKALEIDPAYALAQDNKQLALKEKKKKGWFRRSNSDPLSA